MVMVFALLCLAQQPEVPGLGASAETLSLRTLAGAPMPLAEIATASPLLLVMLPDTGTSALCKSLSQVATLPTTSPMQRLAVVADAAALGSCAATGRVAIAKARADLRLPATVTAMVVDDSLHVRLLLTLAPDSTGWETLRAKLAQWFQGRQTYEANCGHCHGFDGAQASSPETKSLVGITRKYPETKVLELGAQFGGVDMTGWSEAKKETLLSYLRGL
jgi:cytochrome c553